MNWIYHPEHEPQMVNDKEYEQLLQQGWYDTPAKFPKAEATIIVPRETIEEIKEIARAVEKSLEINLEENVDAPKKRGRPPKVKEDDNNNGN